MHRSGVVDMTVLPEGLTGIREAVGPRDPCHRDLLLADRLQNAAPDRTAQLSALSQAARCPGPRHGDALAQPQPPRHGPTSFGNTRPDLSEDIVGPDRPDDCLNTRKDNDFDVAAPD